MLPLSRIWPSCQLLCAAAFVLTRMTVVPVLLLSLLNLSVITAKVTIWLHLRTVRIDNACLRPFVALFLRNVLLLGRSFLLSVRLLLPLPSVRTPLLYPTSFDFSPPLRPRRWSPCSPKSSGPVCRILLSSAMLLPSSQPSNNHLKALPIV